MEFDQELRELIDREVVNLGYELVKLETFFSGRRKAIRVFIDRSDGVTIDDCVRVTKTLGLVLDGIDSLPGPYNLEVSSPGINRPLTRLEHFQRFRGTRARVEYGQEDGTRATVHGEIVGTDDGRVTVAVLGEERSIPFKAIIRANLEPEEAGPGNPRREKRGRRHQAGGENF